MPRIVTITIDLNFEIPDQTWKPDIKPLKVNKFLALTPYGLKFFQLFIKFSFLSFFQSFESF
jgi:hypothetical protein